MCRRDTKLGRLSAMVVAGLAALLAWRCRGGYEIMLAAVHAFQTPPRPISLAKRRGDSGPRNLPRDQTDLMWLSRPTFVQNRWQSPQYMAVIQPEVQEEQEMQSAQLVTLQTSSQAHDEPPTAADATNLPTRTATKLATVAAPETVLAMSDSPLIQGDIASPWNASFSASSPPLGIWASRGLLLLVAAIWGTNFASVKYLEGLCFHPPCHHPASEFAFARFGVAALASIPFLIGQNWRVVLAGVECGLTITLGYVSQALALESIPSGECAFICSLTVVVVPLAAALLYGRPIKVQHGIAAIVALLGVGILEGMFDVAGWLSALKTAVSHASVPAALVTASSSDAAASTVEAALATAAAPATTAAAVGANTVTHSYGFLEPLARFLGVSPGDLLALGQPLGFGYSFLRIEHYQEEFKHVPNRVLTIAAAQCVCVGILSALWVLSDYQFVFPDFGYLIEPHRVAVILWTGIVTTLLAIYLEGVALQTASATDASIAFSSEPVWASLFGFWLLGERLGVESYVGGTVILAACLVGALADTGDAEKNETSNHASYSSFSLSDASSMSSPSLTLQGAGAPDKSAESASSLSSQALPTSSLTSAAESEDHKHFSP